MLIAVTLVTTLLVTPVRVMPPNVPLRNGRPERILVPVVHKSRKGV
jgi:hypothetical protein